LYEVFKSSFFCTCKCGGLVKYAQLYKCPLAETEVAYTLVRYTANTASSFHVLVTNSMSCLRGQHDDIDVTSNKTQEQTE